MTIFLHIEILIPYIETRRCRPFNPGYLYPNQIIYLENAYVRRIKSVHGGESKYKKQGGLSPIDVLFLKKSEGALIRSR